MYRRASLQAAALAADAEEYGRQRALLAEREAALAAKVTQHADAVADARVSWHGLPCGALIVIRMRNLKTINTTSMSESDQCRSLLPAWKNLRLPVLCSSVLLQWLP